MKRSAYIILAVVLCAFVHAQIRQPEKRPVPRIDKTDRTLERQLDYAGALAKRGDANSAYLAYSRMINSYPSEIRVLSGLVDSGVRSGRIKEAESLLKSLAAKYPVTRAYADPSDEKSVFPVRLAGTVAELYLRTGRAAEAEEVIGMIRQAVSSKTFLSELEADIYYRSGCYGKSGAIYKRLRQEKKDISAYSERLFRIYFSEGRTGSASDELVTSVLSAEKNRKNAGNESGFDPAAELFRLYGTDEYKDSIMISARKMSAAGVKGAGVLISELYFSSGDYERSFEELKKDKDQTIQKNTVRDFALKLYREKNYSMANGFFGIYFGDPSSADMDETLRMYIHSLTEAGDIQKAERTIKESGLFDSGLLLAELYHNRAGRPEESCALYEKNLKFDRRFSDYWLDYVLLKISRNETGRALEIIGEVFEKGVSGVFFPETFTRFKYLEAVACLLSGDTGRFTELSAILIGDNYFSDSDNDLLKIRNDLGVIKDDPELLGKYLVLIRKETDSTSDTEEPDFGYREEAGPEKKKFLANCSFRYLEKAGDTEKLKRLCVYITETGIADNISARMIIDFAGKVKDDPDMKEVLMSLLKTGIGEEIKAEVRDIIRENVPS